MKRITGKSVEEQLRLDVEQLFLDVLLQNTEGVTRRELLDIHSMIPILSSAYPKEFSNAKKDIMRYLKRVV